ncbi:MAG TPA: IclR family transcriptional regulator [Ilumatobacteraceae bacterium]|nr:IclR family transcriptional regulator [Ilumatobacteraceae bacterium]
MSVKRVRSAERTLAVIDALAAHQPIGVGALALLLDDDKSAVQRVLMTLADCGWIQPTGTPTKWELSTHVLVLAEQTRGRHTLVRSVRPTMESLRDETGETIVLAVRDGKRIAIIDVVESTQLVRTAPHVGMIIPADTTAGGQAILAALPDTERRALLGGPLDDRLTDELNQANRVGYTVNVRWSGSSSVGAAVVDATGSVLGSLAISAPAERLPAALQRRYGKALAERCRQIAH